MTVAEAPSSPKGAIAGLDRSRLGRTKLKLVSRLESELPAMLSRFGSNVLAVRVTDIWPSASASRSHDDKLGTWGGSAVATIGGENACELGFHFGSYETVTQCARYGFESAWRGYPWASGLDVTGRCEDRRYGRAQEPRTGAR